jgi:hypothetical protein
LQISGIRATDNGLEYLTILTSISRLNLDEIRSTTYWGVIALVSALTALESLSLKYGTYVPLVMLKELLPRLPALRSLTLSDTTVIASRKHLETFLDKER